MNAMTTTASTGDPTITPGTAYNFNWQSASNGQVMMSTCSYWGDDGAVLGPMASADDCAGFCAATANCDYFAWWGNGCYLKMPGITHHPSLSAIVSAQYPIGQCGYVVNRKSVGSWTTNGQLKVAPNCKWAGGSYSTLKPVSITTCRSYITSRSSTFNLFYFSGTNCILMFAASGTNPIPISSNVSTCGYISSRVTIATNGVTLIQSATPIGGVVSP